MRCSISEGKWTVIKVALLCYREGLRLAEQLSGDSGDFFGGVGGAKEESQIAFVIDEINVERMVDEIPCGGVLIVDFIVGRIAFDHSVNPVLRPRQANGGHVKVRQIGFEHLGRIAFGIHADKERGEIACIFAQKRVHTSETRQRLRTGIGTTRIAKKEEKWTLLIGQAKRIAIVIDQRKIAPKRMGSAERVRSGSPCGVRSRGWQAKKNKCSVQSARCSVQRLPPHRFALCVKSNTLIFCILSASICVHLWI